MKKISTFLAFLLFISCVSKNNKTEGSASECNSEQEARITCALAFINTYATDGSKWIDTSDIVTESFKAEYKKVIEKGWKDDPELGLGFDPIISAQDGPDEGYELDYADEVNNYVFAKGKGQPQFRVVIKVIKEADKWKVDGSGIINIPDSISGN